MALFLAALFHATTPQQLWNLINSSKRLCARYPFPHGRMLFDCIHEFIHKSAKASSLVRYACVKTVTIRILMELVANQGNGARKENGWCSVQGAGILYHPFSLISDLLQMPGNWELYMILKMYSTIGSVYHHYHHPSRRPGLAASWRPAGPAGQTSPPAP